MAERLDLPGLSEEALARLENARVLVLGLAGASAVTAGYLREAGMARVESIDDGAFSAHNAEEMVAAHDLVVDGLKRWQDKLTASDACMAAARPLFHCGVDGFAWQQYTMVPGRSACLRCAFTRVGIEDVSRSKNACGGGGPASGMVGALQAAELIKYVARLGSSQGQEFIRYDGLRREFYAVSGLSPSLDCPDCTKPAAR